ncbi:MAG TPA: hypothetical protein PLB02_07785 [Thermoanaerobaculia bacterium]|nr:hypothetical protein [Thermoanaerobaculia bacterium]
MAFVRSGKVAAHSRATIPPSEPPVASATFVTPSASSIRPVSRAMSRVVGTTRRDAAPASRHVVP